MRQPQGKLPDGQRRPQRVGHLARWHVASAQRRGLRSDRGTTSGNVRGHRTYRGDASFAASTATTSFTIGKAPTTVTAGFGTTVDYGNQAAPTAGVLTTSNGVAPTGTFQFYVDGNPLSVPQGVYESFGYGGFVNGNYDYATADATLLTSFLNIGTHTISATYSGDANYAAGTATPTTLAVVKAVPFFEGLGVGNTGGGPVIAGQNTTATATIYGSSHGAPPTGTVIFYVNSVALSGTVTYSTVNSPPTLTATIPTVFSTPGSYPIGASYSCDADYAAATYPVPYSLTVLGPISVARGAGIVVTSPGLGGTPPINVTPNGGFSGTTTVSCTPDPNAKEAACNLTSGTSAGSPPQVSVSGSGATLAFNVTTTAPHQARLDTPSLGAASRIALAGMLLLFLPAIRHRRKFRRKRFRWRQRRFRHRAGPVFLHRHCRHLRRRQPVHHDRPGPRPRQLKTGTITPSPPPFTLSASHWLRAAATAVILISKSR